MIRNFRKFIRDKDTLDAIEAKLEKNQQGPTETGVQEVEKKNMSIDEGELDL